MTQHATDHASKDLLIKADGLHKRYGGHLAVNDLNLELRKGEILGLLGPNGAGKSTTLRMLSGCLAPTSGRVQINGIDISENAKAAKQAIGYLPERPPVYHELSVDEYLTFCAKVHGVARYERASALLSAKRDCGLEHVGHRIIGNLSKGYQQRVGIAQAIIHRPEVIILDEPTVGLDPIQIREIRKLIKDLGEHHTVILSSHILSEIQATCSRVVIINNGHIVFSETLAALAATAMAERILVALRHAPAPDALKVEGVENVTHMADGRFRIDPAPGADPREAIASKAVAEGWGLVELASERKTLEEIFVELTTSDNNSNTTASKEAA